MTHPFPPNLQFTHPWRQYQQKILNETDLLFSQRKFHLVAPPGSGKTILGLELMLRINRKTLILAPTLVIREQWIERLLSDFGVNSNSDWISRELQKPALLTVCTYQALHQAWKTNPQLIEQLQAQQIETLIVDECHHLQKEWWKPIIALKKELDPLLIALTATPPYDINNFEWARYHELCGDIDEVIYTPELVAAGDLCPHQDYLYFTLPLPKESVDLQDFHQGVADFEASLQHNYRFIELLKEHPWLNQTEQYTEAIYENPAYFSALLIGMEGLGKVAPINALGIIGADDSQIPPLSLDWLEILLQNALFDDPYFSPYLEEEPLKRIAKTLRRIGALEQKKVHLRESPKLAKKLRNSVSKLNAINDIAKIEVGNLGKDLRMVILCDHIRKEFLPEDEMDDDEQEHIGVVPIFESLRRTFPLGLEIGVLSGSLVIIPKASEGVLDQLLPRWHLQASDLRRTPLKHDGLYLQIEAVNGKAKTVLVNVITALFGRGAIQTLVGTTALLGEGWDAPEINALVLATFVGAHVLSNQMRGRAIRVHREIKEKTANIWHLVCVDNFSKAGGTDLLTLKRRMSTFYGLSLAAQPTISSGLDRFSMPTLPLSPQDIEQVNYNMAVYAKARLRLQQAWNEAIAKGYTLQEKVRVVATRNQSFKGKRKIALNQAAKVYQKDFRRFNIYSILMLAISFWIVVSGQNNAWNWWKILPSIGLFSFVVVAFDIFHLVRLRHLPQIIHQIKAMLQFQVWGLVYAVCLLSGLVYAITQWGLAPILALLGLILAGWVVALSIFNTTTILNIWTQLSRLHDAQSFFRNVAESLFQSMQDRALLSEGQEDKKPQLNIQESTEEVFELVPSNLDTHSAQLYLNALQELLNPIENPRYLLALQYDLEEDEPLVYYFPVPQAMGKQKKDAEALLEIWKQKLGHTELIYTRTPSGRMDLLKARGQSFGAQPNEYAMRVSDWK